MNRKRFINIYKRLYVLTLSIALISSCKEDINVEYYPPIAKVGFEDISDLIVNNKDADPLGGPDSTFVRIIKLVSDQTNNTVSYDCAFNMVNTNNPTETDTTAFNTYIRLMNPIMRRDSINSDGSLFKRNMWAYSRTVFAKAQKSAAIQIRTIDFVPGVDKTPEKPARYEFLLKILPDKTLPIKYTVDELRNTKKIIVIDGKQLTAPIN